MIKIFSGFYFNCYSSSLEDLQTQAHKAAITDKTKLMNPIVMTIKDPKTPKPRDEASIHKREKMIEYY